MAYAALNGKPFVIGGHYLHFGKYDNVLTNFYCKGCAKFSFDQLGAYDIRNSLILCDETALSADSRSFKTFSEDARFFFQQSVRKSSSCFVWCGQSYDMVDKRIRDLTDNFYYIRPSRIFSGKMSTVIPIDPIFDIFQGKPTMSYEFAPRINYGHIWLPKYWNMIDTSEYILNKSLKPFEIESW